MLVVFIILVKLFKTPIFFNFFKYLFLLTFFRLVSYLPSLQYHWDVSYWRTVRAAPIFSSRDQQRSCNKRYICAYLKWCSIGCILIVLITRCFSSNKKSFDIHKKCSNCNKAMTHLLALICNLQLWIYQINEYFQMPANGCKSRPHQNDGTEKIFDWFAVIYFRL
jgi:hypothetical protein